MFGKLFGWGKDREADPALPAPFHLTLGRVIEIDPLVPRLIPAGAAFSLPSTSLPIVAQGLADLGERTWLHRFYPDEDGVFLQIMGGDFREIERVDEIIVWSVAECQYPSTAEIAALETRMCAATWEHAGQTYRSTWGPEGLEGLTCFWEEVHTADGGQPRRIYQKCAAFARPLGEDFQELLVMAVEEPEDDAPCVSTLIGVQLSENQLLR